MFLELNAMCEENTTFMGVLRVTLYVKYLKSTKAKSLCVWTFSYKGASAKVTFTLIF